MYVWDGGPGSRFSWGFSYNPKHKCAVETEWVIGKQKVF